MAIKFSSNGKTTWGWVNDDKIFSLKTLNHTKLHVVLVRAFSYNRRFNVVLFISQSLGPEDDPASSSVSADAENDSSSQSTEMTSKDTSQKAGQVQQLCRFYSQGRRCYYGKKCRYLHQRASEKDGENGAAHKEKEGNLDGHPSDPQQQLSENSQSGTGEHLPQSSHKTAPVRQERARRPCRYFLSGFCAMEDRCRFLHPQQFPPVEDQTYGLKERSSFRPSAPAARPAKSQEQVKLADLTDEVCKQLRATEIAQLMKRFPKDKLIVQEREDGQLTYYRVTVEATDPDWVKSCCMNQGCPNMLMVLQCLAEFISKPYLNTPEPNQGYSLKMCVRDAWS